jgi:hypothetical protein
MGYAGRSLPGGYKELTIPVFKNKTMELGIEPYFTNELIRQFERSKIARLSVGTSAPVVVEGSIEKVDYEAAGTAVEGDLPYLPSNTALTTVYRIRVVVELRVYRVSDRSLLWQGRVRDERVYSAPQVALDTVNSVNPLYNHSARHQNIAHLAKNMMEEAHDRMTEDF